MTLSSFSRNTEPPSQTDHLAQNAYFGRPCNIMAQEVKDGSGHNGQAGGRIHPCPPYETREDPSGHTKERQG